MPEPLPVLTLYARPGCHLCEQAQEGLARLNFRVQVVDITGQPDLEARYGEDVPVLALRERTLLKGVLGRARLSALKVQLLRERDAGL